ncbi:MAG: TonB-dependent receptor [Verrucomicrobia bacterium]|nr:TonB-dependent receptor [Verrucomicrobiota bacterium]
MSLAAFPLQMIRGEEPEPALDRLKKLSLAELLEVKVATVYGASKHEQKTTEAPSSVSIVTQDDIKKHGHRTLADILNSLRGFYVTYDRGYSYMGVRGFNRPGDFGGRVLLMVDGHRLNDAGADTAPSGTDFPLDVDLIDRVEVIRGPGSSLYGNNAFFAVVNVITRRGRDFDGAELSGSYGSFDTWTGRASYGQRFTNGLEFLVSGTLYDSLGQDRLSFPEFVAENLDGSWARQVFASISYKDFSLQGGFSRRQKDWPTAAYYTIPNSQAPRLFTRDERAYADLTFQRECGDEWLVAARGYCDHFQFDGYYPYDYDADPLTTPTVNRDLGISTSAGLDVSVNKTLWDSHQLTAGGEWRHDFELGGGNWDVDPPATYAALSRSADNLGLYAQDEWRIRKNLIVNAGVRYDHYSGFGCTVNPRAAVIYSPWEPSSFKFLYGQAFRAPNVYELYYESLGTRANPGLQPETIRSYELVWEQRFGPHWRTSVSAFWNDVDGLINQDVDPGADLVSPDDDRLFFNNVGSAVARGIELEVEGKLPGRWRGLASYTFADTQDGTSRQRLNNSPQHLAKLNLSVPLWREKIFASLELQAMSRRETVTGNTSAPYAIANFTLFSRELVKGLELSASLYNLLDQRYTHPVSVDFGYIGPISGNPVVLDTVRQDGRSFRVKLTYRF